MYCTKCGKQNEGVSFCIYCGTPLNTESAQVPAQAPVQALPAAAVKKGLPKGAIIGIAAAAAAAAVTGAVLLISSLSGGNDSPLDKSMNAVFPETVLAENTAEKGGSITIGARLGSDILGYTGLDEAVLEITAASTSDGKALLEANIDADGTKYDADLVYDGEKLALSSQSFLGKNSYYIDFRNILKQLENSVFSPDSGTSYSLDRSTYSQIETFLESFDSEKNDVKKDMAVVTSAVGKVMKKAVAKADHEKSGESITIDGESFKANKTSYSLNKELAAVFAKELQAEWKENKELRRILDDYLSSVQGGSYVIGMIENLMDEDPDDILDSVLGGIKLNGSIDIYTAGAYLAMLDVNLKIGSEYGNTTRFSMNLEFSKDPVKKPRMALKLHAKYYSRTLFSADAEYSREKEGSSTSGRFRTAIYAGSSGYSVDLRSDTQKDGRYKTTASIGQYSGYEAPARKDYETVAEATITGKYIADSDSMYLSVDGLSAGVREWVYDEDKWESSYKWRDIDIITNSEFYIEQKTGRQNISAPKDSKNIMELDEDDIRDIIDGFSDISQLAPYISGAGRSAGSIY